MCNAVTQAKGSGSVTMWVINTSQGQTGWSVSEAALNEFLDAFYNLTKLAAAANTTAVSQLT